MGSLQICWHLRATNFCFVLIIYCCSVTVGISTVLPEVAQEVPALLLLKLLVFAWPQFNACRLSIVANNILQLSLQAMCNRPCIGICSLTAPPTGSGRSGRLKTVGICLASVQCLPTLHRGKQHSAAVSASDVQQTMHWHLLIDCPTDWKWSEWSAKRMGRRNTCRKVCQDAYLLGDAIYAYACTSLNGNPCCCGKRAFSPLWSSQ